MLRVNKRSLAARLLHLCNDMQRHGGLTRGLGPKDLDDSALGHAADAKRHIQRNRAGGNRLHLHVGVLAQTHDRARAKLTLDLRHSGIERSLLFCLLIYNNLGCNCFLCHINLPAAHGGLNSFETSPWSFAPKMGSEPIFR